MDMLKRCPECGAEGIHIETAKHNTKTVNAINIHIRVEAILNTSPPILKYRGDIFTIYADCPNCDLHYSLQLEIGGR